MRPIHIAALVLLGSLWGASFLFIGIAVHAFGPLGLMFLRVLAAGLLLVLVAGLLRRRLPAAGLQLRTRWRRYLVLGAVTAPKPEGLGF